mgnify:FL=1
MKLCTYTVKLCTLMLSMCFFPQYISYTILGTRYSCNMTANNLLCAIQIDLKKFIRLNSSLQYNSFLSQAQSRGFDRDFTARKCKIHRINCHEGVKTNSKYIQLQCNCMPSYMCLSNYWHNLSLREK